MEKTTSITLAVLALCFITTVCAEHTIACTTGSGCFPNGRIPDGVTSDDATYYCCPQRNFTRHDNRLPDGAYNCTCVLDLTLESKTEEYARSLQGKGRMCLLGKDCEGAKYWGWVNRRFKYCCYSGNRTYSVTNMTTTVFDGDKAEFILCRCLHLSVPSPDPKAYVVPHVQTYDSTGEICSYDKGCQEKPFAKCQTQWPYKVTFCCYGSRGIVTESDGKKFTRCTCTDKVYGGQCEARPVMIAESTTQCLSECSSKPAEDTCTDRSQAVRCCPYNMAVVATQSGGSFTSCKCKAQAKKSCGLECDTECSNRTVEDTCTDSSQATRCCPPGLAVVATQSGDNFTSCTCKEQTQKLCGNECDTGCNNRTVEDTCTDSSQATRCCPPGLAVVATQSGGNFTSCTCKEQTQKLCGNECDTGCSNRTVEDTCTDSSQATRCCPPGLAVVATQSGGNFTSCTCKEQTQKLCGNECDTGCSNRTVEDTCTDSSQATRCCPPGLAVVATQSGGNFTSCTCKEQTQKSCGNACLTECNGRTDSEKCTDDFRAVRCCPRGLAVVATQSGGNFTSCVCKARVQRSCGKATSFATRVIGRLTDIIPLVFAAFLLGRF